MTTLVLPGERPTDTVARLDRLPGPELIALSRTPEYQRILEAAAREAADARRFTRRMQGR